MFPYIVTFQNKLKGVTVQYIRKILGIVFFTIIHYLSVISINFCIRYCLDTYFPEKSDSLLKIVKNNSCKSFSLF